MKTRSLILTAPEVRAALRGELRLVVRPVKGLGNINYESVISPDTLTSWGYNTWVFEAYIDKAIRSKGVRCPLGVPGTVLRCREAWQSILPLSQCTGHRDFRFAADVSEAQRRIDSWRSPATMPTWASRITLEVESVRCVSVQELTEDDALACGFEWTGEPGQYGDGCTSPLHNFEDAWDSRYAARGLGWDSNPWVWTVGVRRVEG